MFLSGGKSLFIIVLILLNSFLPLFGEDVSADIPELQTDEEILIFHRPLRQYPASPPNHFQWHGEGEFPLTISGLDQELTRHYIDQYSTSGGLSWLTSVMERSKPYIAFIRQ